MNSGDDELERNRRAVQDQIDEATSSRPARTRTADDNDWEDENDDMDYEPTTGEDSDEMQEFFEQLLEDQEEEDDDENAEDEDFEDAPEYSTIEIEIDASGGEAEEDGIQNITAARRRQVLRLLASSQLGRLFMSNGGGFGFHRRRGRLDPDRFPKVPSEEGARLMSSGEFGVNELQSTNSITSKKRLARRILDREMGKEEGSRRKINQQLMVQGMLPSTHADMIVHYNSPVYSGQFSDDGNFFYACVKDFKVRMYDTSNPYNWIYYKTVNYYGGAWTLTDATLSPDNKFLAYSSIQPNVHLSPTDPNDLGDGYVLDLYDGGRRQSAGLSPGYGGFGIWSIRFSGDGRELVAGTNANSVVVYDIESRRTVLEIPGHDEDVNAVCFGDASSPHVIYSGSDDATLRIWDRRSLGDSREAGAFVGHTEGLTYIDSKGDGRYIISNGKESSCKLWDLRMAMTTARFSQIDTQAYTTNFDYRWGAYDEDDYKKHPHDNSLVTFRGHKVLRTLIRCHFSPPGSTNSRYVYSGSADGKVYVWNLDATLAGTIDVLSATRDSRPYNGAQSMYAWDDNETPHWNTCVRDASFHPFAPVVAASSWNGYGLSSGTVSTHSWGDGIEEDKSESIRVNDKLIRDPSLYSIQPRSRDRRRARLFEDDE